MRQETYSYGQGKVFLAERLPNGEPGSFRWVGDVSELSVALSVESLTHKESYSGQRQEVRKIITGKSGEVSVKFHELSKANLALMVHGAVVDDEAGTVSDEPLPETIQVGDRFALKHQNVSAVTIPSLTEGTDFIVDSVFGAIEFLKAQSSFKKKVSYSYGATSSIPLLNSQPKELFLRFEGINLAESNEWNLVELYKISFDPTESLNLINNENALDALNAKAKILADTTKKGDGALGRFGRVVKIQK